MAEADRITAENQARNNVLYVLNSRAASRSLAWLANRAGAAKPLGTIRAAVWLAGKNFKRNIETVAKS